MRDGKDTDSYRLLDEDGYNWLAVANMVQKIATVKLGGGISRCLST